MFENPFKKIFAGKEESVNERLEREVAEARAQREAMIEAAEQKRMKEAGELDTEAKKYGRKIESQTRELEDLKDNIEAMQDPGVPTEAELLAQIDKMEAEERTKNANK